MKVRTWTKYDVGYLPTSRCRKLRYREEEEYIDFEVKEVTKAELEPAFDTGVMIYSYDNRLWRIAGERDIHCGNEDKPMTALEALIYAGVTYSCYFGKWQGYTRDALREGRDDVVSRAERDMNNYLVVDGVLYKTTSEPMYCIYTFGLGHNHGGIGTSLSIDNHYNSNISNERYFNALEYEEALTKALDIASRRGDTNSFDFIKSLEPIKVFDNKFITRCPNKEHGNGNTFINSIESVIENSKDSTESGFLAMAMAFTNI